MQRQNKQLKKTVAPKASLPKWFSWANSVVSDLKNELAQLEASIAEAQKAYDEKNIIITDLGDVHTDHFNGMIQRIHNSYPKIICRHNFDIAVENARKVGEIKIGKLVTVNVDDSDALINGVDALHNAIIIVIKPEADYKRIWSTIRQNLAAVLNKKKHIFASAIFNDLEQGCADQLWPYRYCDYDSNHQRVFNDEMKKQIFDVLDIYEGYMLLLRGDGRYCVAYKELFVTLEDERKKEIDQDEHNSI